MSHGAFASQKLAAPASRNGKQPSSRLRIGDGDSYFEREADRIADQITDGSPKLDWSLSRLSMQAPLQRKCSCGGAEKCEHCDEKEKKEGAVQRKAAGPPVSSMAPAIVREVLNSPGRPLGAPTRRFYESRFDYDFSRVRIHNDSRAAQSAESINALAYASGSDIVFATGMYTPDSPAGRHLLAHELAHVVQQDGRSAQAQHELLAGGHHAEREAQEASRVVGAGGKAEIKSRLPEALIGRAEKGGGGNDATPGASGGGAGATSGGSAPASGEKPQPLRFDVIGADLPLVDFLSKTAGLSRDPDLRVTSLEDLITKLEQRAPAGSPRCVQHLSFFNHGRPGYQLIAGGVDKKGTATPLPKSYLSLEWLYQPANQPLLARLRNVFCCTASMDWLGCGVAGVVAQGGTRTEEEIEKAGKLGPSEKSVLDERFKEMGDRYQSEADAQKHGASLQGATFGRTAVGTWADATCTSIRAATDFVFFNASTGQYNPGFRGQFLEFKPSAAGECSCDQAAGRITGKWDPGKGVDLGNQVWQNHLSEFNYAVNPPSGSPDFKKVSAKMLQLFGDTAGDLQVPPGLPAGPKVEPWIDAKSTNPQYVARTMDHMALCFPSDCWKWIAVNRTVFQQTPGYTKTTLNHELQHALDIYVSLFEYKLVNGPPPTAPADACTPKYEPKEDDPYGKYILDFRKFRASGLPEMRHLDIYATSAAPNFQRFSPTEKLEWFKGMITEVPGNIAASESLPTEGPIASVYRNPLPYEADLRASMEARLFDVVNFFIYGNNAGKGADLGKAATLINHFSSVWNVNPGHRAQLAAALKTEEEYQAKKPKESPSP